MKSESLKIIKICSLIFICVFVPLVYPSSQIQIVGYGLCGDYIVVGKKDKTVCIYDLEGSYVSGISLSNKARYGTYEILVNENLILIAPNRNESYYLYNVDGKLVEEKLKEQLAYNSNCPRHLRISDNLEVTYKKTLGIERLYLFDGKTEIILYQTDLISFALKFILYFGVALLLCWITLCAAERNLALQ